MTDFHELLDLASPRIGGRVIAANDEFFAPKENLIKPEAAVFLPDEFTDRGKWMDGWETRRRRDEGYDWCILQLGVPGRIAGVQVDTAHFKGNHPEQCSLEGCYADGEPGEDAEWVTLVSKTGLAGDSKNDFAVVEPRAVTHIRLNIFPDGGVARLRVYGEPLSRWNESETVNLAAAERGARVVSCSDSFFSSRHNLILPGQSLGMWDGWETKRRSPGVDDWVVVRLAAAGTIERVLVDTSHFKGNAPGEISLDAGTDPDDSESWTPIVGRTKVQPHAELEITEIASLDAPVSQVRFHIYPDGGVARLRIFGHVSRAEAEARGIAWMNALPEDALRRELQTVCGSAAWVEAMAGARPYADAGKLLEKASQTWTSLSEDDWLEAFGAHPRIGERSKKRFSKQEQAGARGATAEQQAELVRLNEEYEKKHGFVFLICATGKNSDEMLSALRTRLKNDRSTEISNAADEQNKIIELRLEKLLRG